MEGRSLRLSRGSTWRRETTYPRRAEIGQGELGREEVVNGGSTKQAEQTRLSPVFHVPRTDHHSVVGRRVVHGVFSSTTARPIPLPVLVLVVTVFTRRGWHWFLLTAPPPVFVRIVVCRSVFGEGGCKWKRSCGSTTTCAPRWDTSCSFCCSSVSLLFFLNDFFFLVLDLIVNIWWIFHWNNGNVCLFFYGKRFIYLKLVIISLMFVQSEIF